MRERLISNGKLVVDLIDGQPAAMLPTAPRKTTAADVRRFISTVARAAMTLQPLESQGEANRRAHICATCPLNVPIEGCEVCKSALRKVSEYIGDRKVDDCNLLQGCGVCGCELRLAVWVNLRAQQEAMDLPTNALFPNHCWKKR